MIINLKTGSLIVDCSRTGNMVVNYLNLLLIFTVRYNTIFVWHESDRYYRTVISDSEMKHSTNSIGSLVRETRKLQGLTQSDLALVCGTGKRFIVDLEKGKPTCEFAKVLNALQMLGIEIQLNPPYTQDIE